MRVESRCGYHSRLATDAATGSAMDVLAAASIHSDHRVNSSRFSEWQMILSVELV